VKEIRIHGRGGQGAVLAAELMIVAAYEDHKFGQAFPAFGGERRGAPVQAFIRLDDEPIRVRHRVTSPDWIIILDSTILETVDVMQGLRPDSLVVINSEVPPFSLPWTQEAWVCCIPATRIARDVFGKPLINAVMLGAFSVVTDAFSILAIQNAFRQRFPGEMGDMNSRLVQEAEEWCHRTETVPVKVAKSRPAFSLAPWETSEGLGAQGQPLHFAAATGPRTALAYRTGTWRYSKPVFDLEKCTGCGFCDMYCPDACVIVENKKYYADYEYCKGCGICAHECPADAIQMVAEEG
jgi:pyruvate ferredoxin oxidoreductase gamma subunit